MILAGFVAVQTIVFFWIQYLDRPENRYWIESEEFELRCSSVVKAGKATLYINTRESQYSSISRIDDCDSLLEGTFSKIRLFVRHNQDAAFGIRIDETVILEPDRSTYPTVFLLIVLVFLPVLGLWIDQHRRK